MTLALPSVAMVARMTRSSVLEVLREDYVRTARAKGVGERLVVAKHALRNAAIPILTLLGLQAGQLMGGAVLTETVFAWPGPRPPHGQGDLRPRLRPAAGRGAGLRAGLRVINLLVDLSYGAARPAHRTPGLRPCRGASPGDVDVRLAGLRRASRPSPRDAWERFRRSRLALAGLVPRGAAGRRGGGAAPWLAPADPAKQSLIEKRARPGGKFLLGADEFGRDILSRVIYGAAWRCWWACSRSASRSARRSLLGCLAGFAGRLARRR